MAASLAAALAAGAARASEPALPSISIIIDDLGERHAAGLRALRLPGAMAYAFLPLTPFAQEQAEQAHREGKEVLLHLPLEASGGARLTPTGITRGSDVHELAQRLRISLASVPHARGVNNHQGSALTESRRHMDWLMTELRARGNLYFVDSRTSPHSLAYGAARLLGVPSAARDVFLDDSDDEVTIREQWQRLLRVARTHGTALAIGHPRPATLKVLEEELPRLAEAGIRLVLPSQLIRHRGGDQPVFKRLKLTPALLPTTTAVLQPR